MESGADTPSPVEVRDRIREEHRQLSARLARVEALSQHARGGDAATFRTLREELQSLGTALDDHLHYEEYRLPALATGGETTEHVHAAMRKEHEAQRELLKRVIQDLDETAVGQELLVGVLELTHAIRDDMALEEEEILSKI
ncbi:MAG: hemerythrin domain-containing protein [Polyangiales bacterium]